jgi:hypothetical protein
VRKRDVLAVVFGCALASGCGGGSSGTGASAAAGGPNVDSSQRVVALSTADQATLCDWIANEWGGYGGLLRCDAGSETLSAPTSPQDCYSGLLASFEPSCPLTVGQLSSCVEWQAENVCLVGTIEAAMLPPACQATIAPACTAMKGSPDGGAD